MAQREIKKIDPTSLAKVMGLLYAFLGVIIGLLFAGMGSILSNLPMAEDDEAARTIINTVFGVGGIIFFPIFYGIIGLIARVITGFLYNLVAGWIGGVRIEVGE